MINTVIFDIGNVLAHFGWKDYLLSCNYDEETLRRISNATVQSDFWLEWDRGAKESTELIELSVSKEPGLEKEIRDFFENFHSMIVEYDYAADLVKQLRSNNYKVYILSNYSKTGYEMQKDSFEFMKYIDGGIVSYKIKHVKPEPAIYYALIEKYQFNPSEAVFLDDLQVNVDAAKELGFHAIRFENYDQAMEELRELGVRI